MEPGFRERFSFRSHTEITSVPSLQEKEAARWRVSPWEVVGIRYVTPSEIVAGIPVMMSHSQFLRIAVSEFAVAFAKWYASRLFEAKELDDFGRNE